MKYLYYKKKFVIVGILAVLLVIANIAIINPFTAHAAGDLYGLNTSVNKAPDLKTDSTLPQITGAIINYAFGLLGTVFMIVILLGGYKWLTSMGNEEKVQAAKHLISMGIYGMIIIFLAYAISYAVIYGLEQAVTNPGSPAE